MYYQKAKYKGLQMDLILFRFYYGRCLQMRLKLKQSERVSSESWLEQIVCEAPPKKKKNPTNQLKRYVRTYVSNCKKGIQKNTKKLFNRSFGLEQHTLGSLRNEK